MADVIAELKALRLHGMAATWAELGEQRNAEVERSRWLLEHMLQAEVSDRATRSVQHQMNSAKFPVHRDLARFDFEVSPVDRKLVTQLANCEFTAAAHNVVLVGGPGTGKTHLATAIGVADRDASRGRWHRCQVRSAAPSGSDATDAIAQHVWRDQRRCVDTAVRRRADGLGALHRSKPGHSSVALEVLDPGLDDALTPTPGSKASRGPRSSVDLWAGRRRS